MDTKENINRQIFFGPITIDIVKKFINSERRPELINRRATTLCHTRRPSVLTYKSPLSFSFSEEFENLQLKSDSSIKVEDRADLNCMNLCSKAPNKVCESSIIIISDDEDDIVNSSIKIYEISDDSIEIVDANKKNIEITPNNIKLEFSDSNVQQITDDFKNICVNSDLIPNDFKDQHDQCLIPSAASTPTEPVYNSPMMLKERKLQKHSKTSKFNFKKPNYKNITSPVALYIRNTPTCPQVQKIQLKEVFPKRLNVKSSDKKNISQDLPMHMYKPKRHTAINTQKSPIKLITGQCLPPVNIIKHSINKNKHHQEVIDGDLTANISNNTINSNITLADN